MFRLRSVFALLVLALAVGACSGGDKPSVSKGDAAYIDQVIPFISGCSSEQATDNAALGRILKQRSNAWNAIHPPSNFASLHDAYARALEKAADDYSSAASNTTTPDQKAALSFNDSLSAFFVWYAAFKARFGPSLFTVEGASMEPAFGDGTTVAIHEPASPIERWQLAIFKFPLDLSRNFIKRVVALPGETIEVRDENIYVNGAVAAGDIYAKDAPNYSYSERTVPADMYWVLGDNRRNSFDSHAWGASCAQQQCDFVPRNLILGVLPPDTKGCTTGVGTGG